MENWETGGNLLKPRHFEFPSRLLGLMGDKVNNAPVLSSETAVGSLLPAGASALCHQDQFAPFTRRYQPEPAALEELVELLHKLLTEMPVDEPSASPEPTCFFVAPE